MKINLDTKYLIDRYAQEVGTHVPRKQRAEIILGILDSVWEFYPA